MKALDKDYPLIKPRMLVWSIPIVIVAGVSTLIGVLGLDGTPNVANIIIGAFAVAALIGISITGFTQQVLARHRVRKMVLAVGTKLAVRTEAHITPTMISWIANLVEFDPIPQLLKVLNAHVRIQRMSIPYVFLTLKKPGKMMWEWNSISKKARGIPKRSWCEVEWHSDKPELSSALALHEISHIILTCGNGGLSEELQHELIKNYEVESLLRSPS